MTFKPIYILPAILVAGCSTLPAGMGGPPLPTQIGSTATIGDLRITPLVVKEDSRCPPDVQCVQAGRVVVNARLESPTDSMTQDLVLGQPVQFAGGSVTLAEVWPKPQVNFVPAQGNYSFRFTYDNY